MAVRLVSFVEASSAEDPQQSLQGAAAGADLQRGGVEQGRGGLQRPQETHRGVGISASEGRVGGRHSSVGVSSVGQVGHAAVVQAHSTAVTGLVVTDAAVEEAGVGEVALTLLSCSQVTEQQQCFNMPWMF